MKTKQVVKSKKPASRKVKELTSNEIKLVSGGGDPQARGSGRPD